MKKIKPLLLFAALLACTLVDNAQIPFLKKNTYNATQLMVNGKPFLMLAGEVNNSSGSYIAYMEKTMKALHDANLNSVLVSVSWEIIEPQESAFDFTSVDELIRIARKNNLKIGILWFGSWKNGLSPYAPIWVVKDTKRFPRIKNDKGENTRTLTPLSNTTRDADARAFAGLMKHIAAVDSKENTIIVMQVENEMGILGQTRDYSPEANRTYQLQVPAALIQYMVKNKATLETELKTDWENNGSKTKGSWSEIFGKNEEADLFFMAWNYSLYANAIAAAGKKEYNIPMYVNCWMPNPRPTPGKPGNYPSGGPILSVLDIWKAGAPSIDMLAPDLYGGDFKEEANSFHRFDNPLFIPETHPIEGPATYVFAQQNALCFSPFGIDNKGDNMAKEYKLLSGLMPLITKYQGSGKMTGLYKNGGDSIGRDIKLNDEVTVSLKYQKPFRRPISTDVKNRVADEQEPACYGLFIQTGENEFMVAGLNLSVSAHSTSAGKEIWLKDAWEVACKEGIWKPIALHNGDEAGFLRSGDPIYGIRAYRSFPSEPAVFQFKVAVYDK